MQVPILQNARAQITAPLLASSLAFLTSHVKWRAVLAWYESGIIGWNHLGAYYGRVHKGVSINAANVGKLNAFLIN